MSASQLQIALRPSVVRDRQRISTTWLYLLLCIALAPPITALARLFAILSPQPSGLLSLGEWLNHTIVLFWIGEHDRDVVLYILLLPLAALLTALTRLTLGIRVLGFRAILIAIGFQEIGVLPCLLLILIIAVTVVLVRPVMRRSGFPLYARVAVILCIVALTMIMGLLSGVWLNSPTLWSMAFFPVVILAMLAESIAKTVARESIAVAVWRTASTILLALLIAAISQITSLQVLLMGCPELVFTILVLIIFTAEFLDLRLMERFLPGFLKSSDVPPGRPRIVIVRNRFPEPPPRRVSKEPPLRYRRATLQTLIDGLRQRRYPVTVLEGDSTLPSALSKVANDTFRDATPGLLVMNFAGGLQGAACQAQTPMICEMLGLAYSGPAPQAPALLDDRLEQLQRLRAASLRIPKRCTWDEALEHVRGGNGVWIRVRYASDRAPMLANGERQLRRLQAKMRRRFGEVLFEKLPPGRSLTVVILHPERDASGSAQAQASFKPTVLPLLELNRDRYAFRACSDIDSDSRRAIEVEAMRAAAVLGCRDCARVDLNYDERTGITIGRVLAVDPLTGRSAAGQAASLAGMDLADLAEKILWAALLRQRETATMPAPYCSVLETRSQQTAGV